MTETADARRLLWADVAKGACIVLVVLHHVVGKVAVQALDAAGLSVAADAWEQLTLLLKPLRMPLFFLVSGVFAAGAVRRPWRASRARLAGGYYLYVVWLLVYVAFYAVETASPANRTTSVRELLGDLVWAETSMWFLQALVLYFVVARLVRRLPVLPVLAVAAALSAASGAVGIEENNKVAVLAHLVYFLVGALLPEVVRRAAATSRPSWRLAAAYVVLGLAAVHLPLPWTVGSLLASAAGLPLGVALAVRLARTGLADPLAWLGRRTLHVYVLHLVVLLSLVPLLGPLLATGAPTAVLVLAPVWLTALVAAGSLALGALLERSPLRSLLVPPAVVTGRRTTPARERVSRSA
ncbi:MAG: pyridoxal-5'-phosphate-dependent protein subunit beta [Nocardioides sp.]|nr:pyridoxal-5'-phosphate-dependent protein subunit beta [Nocardioides sp.]